jgi:hypothetical protein
MNDGVFSQGLNGLKVPEILFNAADGMTRQRLRPAAQGGDSFSLLRRKASRTGHSPAPPQSTSVLTNIHNAIIA